MSDQRTATGLATAARRRTSRAMSQRRGVGGTCPLVGLYGATGSPGRTKRNVSDGNSLVDPSN